MSRTFDAHVEGSALDRRYAVVDPAFAAKLRTEHQRTFEVVAEDTAGGREQLTADVPNVGADDLAHLDERGLPRRGTRVEPGTILVGKATPLEGSAPTAEEKLLRAIFGEAVGELRDTSLRAPPGCFGVVADVGLSSRGDAVARASVEVVWERDLEVGDVLLVNGEPVVVAAIEPLGADLAWSGGASTATVAKAAMARDVLHARSIGPYSQVLQQPELGRERFGGQPLELDQVERLAAHAPWALWEMLTIKSDSISGRTRAYESIIKQENPDVVPRAVAAPEVAPSPPAGGMSQMFSFFEPIDVAAPGEVPALQPEVVTVLAAYLRALGFEARLRAAEPTVMLLSSESLRASSRGAVLKAETLHAGTGKPVPDGLRCERIFGPLNDYECACGKYRRMKFRGVVCEACGVEVVSSKVRRERFGHVDLVTPCLHPLLAGEVASVLGLSEGEVREVARGERVLHGQGRSWHTEPGANPQGGRVLWDALAGLDLEAIDAIETGPAAELASALVEAELTATALMLDAVPVLPPGLRPPLARDGGEPPLALDDLYRRLVNRNNRLRRLLELSAPEIILVNEHAQLQDAVDELMVAGRAPDDEDEDDEGSASLVRFIDAVLVPRLLSKPVDHSGVAHLVVDPSLLPGECRVPRAMLVELFKPHAYAMLEACGYATTIKSAKRLVTQGRPEGLAAIEAASEGHPVLLMAGSTVVARRVRAWDGPAIAVDEATARHLASLTVTLHVPLMHEAALQCAALDDGARAEEAPCEGWLCRSLRHGGLVREVVGAALQGERDRLDDPRIALALGRPPAALDEAEVEQWAEQERKRRAEQWERLHPEPRDPGHRARNPWLDRSLDELELSVRTSNALAHAGMRTIGELCQRTEAELLRIKGFGRNSLAELEAILAELSLSLGMRDA